MACAASGSIGAKWQLGILARIDGTIEPGLLEWAVCRVVGEAEPLRATFFEADGQLFQKAVDYPDVELARYNLRSFQDPAREAYRLAVVDPAYADAVEWPVVQICVVADADR